MIKEVAIMSEGSTYVISQAVKKTGLRSHTIRYWEEELELPISRDSMGRRYYTNKDIQLFLRIKELKSKGFQLKAIALMLPDLEKVYELDSQSMSQLRDEMNSKVIQLSESKYKDNYGNEGGEILKRQEISPTTEGKEKQEVVVESKTSNKMQEFQQIMTSIITDAMKANNHEITEVVSEQVTERVIKEMDYLFRVKEDHEEERFKKFDELLRDVQKGRLEAAATIPGKKKRKRLFGRKKR